MRICAIFNPRSGSWAHTDLAPGERPASLIARWLSPEHPEEVLVQPVSMFGEGARLAHVALAAGYEAVVAVGGDGTINDVVQGFCDSPLRENGALGLIPMGTANVLAQVLGIPYRDQVAAAALITSGSTRHIDLARTDRKWFCLVAGVGFDGAVAKSVDTRLKWRLGEVAYVLAAAQVALQYPSRRVSVTIDDGEPQWFDAYLVLIANGSRYAGKYSLGNTVRVDDGLLDVFVLDRRGPLLWAVIEHGLALALDQFAHASGVHHFRAKKITVDADEALPVEVDGDAAGETPISIEVAHRAIRVFAPPATGTGRLDPMLAAAADLSS